MISKDTNAIADKIRNIYTKKTVPNTGVIKDSNKKKRGFYLKMKKMSQGRLQGRKINLQRNNDKNVSMKLSNVKDTKN